MSEFEPLIRRLCRELWATGSEFEDMLQEGRVAAWQAIRDHDPAKGSLPAFVQLCVRRRLIDRVQRSRRHAHLVLTEASRFEHGYGLDVPDARDTHDTVAASEELRRILKACERLTPLERRVLAGHLAGLAYREIGEPKQVDNALGRARRKLRAA